MDFWFEPANERTFGVWVPSLAKDSASKHPVARHPPAIFGKHIVKQNPEFRHKIEIEMVRLGVKPLLLADRLQP